MHHYNRQNTSKSYVDVKRKVKHPGFDVGHWVRVKKKKVLSHKLKRVLSDPLKLVGRIGPFTFQLHRSYLEFS